MFLEKYVQGAASLAYIRQITYVTCQFVDSPFTLGGGVVSGRFNPLTPNDHYSGRTASLTFKRFLLYIYSTNIFTECFKHVIHSPCFSLQNAVCFIIVTYLVPVLFTFYIQVVLKLKKKSGAKSLTET